MAFQVPALGGTNAVQQIGRFTTSPAVLTAMQNASTGNSAQFDQLVAYASMESGLNPGARASGSRTMNRVNESPGSTQRPSTARSRRLAASTSPR